MFTGNLNTVGTTENVSTSDEETPTAPPRTRTLENGNAPMAIPRRYLNNKEKSRGEYILTQFQYLSAFISFDLVFWTEMIEHQLIKNIFKTIKNYVVIHLFFFYENCTDTLQVYCFETLDRSHSISYNCCNEFHYLVKIFIEDFISFIIFIIFNFAFRLLHSAFI